MNDRIERLKTEAAELNVAKGAGRDGLWQIAGALAMAVGVVVAFVAYQLSLTKSDDLDILSLIILALSMLALAVTGAALFLRYSLARFLRFWLLRQLYEGQSHIDQVVAALNPPVESGAAPVTPANSDHAGEPAATTASD